MNRRALLQSTAAAIALAASGCSDRLAGDSDGSGTEPNGTTASPTESNDSGTTTTLAVQPERLQPGVVVLAIDSLGVVGDDLQFLYLSVEATADGGGSRAGDPPERSDLAFRFDGETYAPGRSEAGNDQVQLYRASGSDTGRYDAESGSGWVLFELPATGDASDAALTWETTVWEPSPALRSRLAKPSPSLSLDWSVPATPTPGETPMEFSVTNESDRDGRFVAGLDESGIRTARSPVEAFSRRVPAGETVRWETVHENGVTADSDAVDDGESDGTYVLSWTGGRRERTVRFVPESASG